jgi:NAD(P)-dependent dehydrogenase (short-subunit alcohol dehydrogenase family)
MYMLWQLSLANHFPPTVFPSIRISIMSTYPLSGKLAIVTGAGSGIGHALTKLLLSAGCSVVLADLKLRPEAEQTLADYHYPASTPSSPTAVFHPTDVADWTHLASLWETAIKCFGRVDILASVAGIYEPPSSSFWKPPEISSEARDPADASTGQYKTFAVNQIAPIRLAQIAMDYWTQHRDIQGNYLAVASISAYLHSIETPLYMASKAALVSFVKSLGPVRDLFGIRMSVVCPGPVLVRLPPVVRASLPLFNLREP